MLQENSLTGVLFLLGIFWGGINMGVAALLAGVFQLSTDDIVNGLFSYNAILCAITFAGNTKKDSMWVLISVLLSFVVSYLFYQFKLIPLTLPFVVSAFLFTLVKRKFA